MSNSRLHYLAYGSNLHPYRLSRRVPSACPIGVVPLPNRRLVFQKRGADGSGKCYITAVSESAHVASDSAHFAFGVVYDIAAEDKADLDRIEGLGEGYNEETLTVELGAERLDAFVYVADPAYLNESLSPYHWYKEMVVLGARFHALPSEYVSRIETVLSKPDLDSTRESSNADILESMRRLNRKM